jgi:hypothetical protein
LWNHFEERNLICLIYTHNIFQWKKELKDLWKEQEQMIRMWMKKIYEERLRGDIVLTESVWQDHYLDYTKHYRNTTIYKDNEGGVLPNDVSVIYNMQCLGKKYLTTVHETQASNLVYSHLKGAGRKVFFKVPDASGPDMSLEKAQQVLDKVCSDKWTQETLKAKLPEDCKADINHKESCPDIEAGFEDVIKAFEV